jgi:hypothetical protein
VIQVHGCAGVEGDNTEGAAVGVGDGGAEGGAPKERENGRRDKIADWVGVWGV